MVRSTFVGVTVTPTLSTGRREDRLREGSQIIDGRSNSLRNLYSLELNREGQTL